ncbi:hypothetical protein D3C85_1825350 [compost metagenome]
MQKDVDEVRVLAVDSKEKQIVRPLDIATGIDGGKGREMEMVDAPVHQEIILLVQLLRTFGQVRAYRKAV